MPLVQDERGIAVVEFAMVAPLFLILVFAMVDIGRAFYTVSQVASAVREGARVASVQPQPSTANAPAVRNAMRAASAGLGTATLADNMIEIVPDEASSRVTVRVREYPMAFVTPFAKAFGRSSLKITREATFHWEYAP